MNKLYTLLFFFVPALFFSYTNANPLAASCTPQTTSYTSSANFGILNVTFNTINNTTVAGADGYKDYSSAIKTNVFAGQTYTISINVSGANPGKHNVRIWIDYNNNGILDSINELAFSANSVLMATGAINIPGNATLNTELRMRISADYELSSPLTPCHNIQYGQAEDYSISILTNPNPPAVSFHAEETVTCNGIVNFFDDSQNVPSFWLWNFGDGSTSGQQNPVYTYTSSGTYTVKLTASNTNGSDVDSIINYVQVTLGAAPVTPSCTPVTLAYCCQFGITNVTLNTINHTSVDAVEGYQDFSCTKKTTLLKSTSYPISIGTGSLNPHDLKVWIDFDNNGIFNPTSELVFTSLNQNSPTGSIAIPATPVFDTPLRMRVIADFVGDTIEPCHNTSYGQAEDYSVIIPSGVSVAENQFENSLSVFPNPTNGIVNIHYTFEGAQNFSVFIYNTTGQLILKKENISASSTYGENFDLGGKPEGLYFIQLVNGNDQTTQRVILQ